MNTGGKRAAVMAFSAFLVMGLLAGCSKKEETFDADATAVTINDETLSAGLLNFAVHYAQAESQYIYDMYFGENSFSYDMGTGYTIGDMVKEDAISSLEQMVLAKQHEEEYGVSLSEEEETAISEAAEAFIDSNEEELLTSMSATRENVEEYLSLTTIEAKMEPEMTADVDTEVSDEEAAQRRVKYAYIDAETEEEDDDGEEIVYEEGETETEDPELRAALEDAYAKAEEVILLIEGGTDFDDALAQVDEDLTATETTFGADDTSLSEGLITYTDGVEDETLVTTPIPGPSGYYVAYVESALDREATDEEKEEIVAERKEEALSELFSEWEEDADISTDDAVISAITFDYNLELYAEEESEWYEDESDWYEDETDWYEEESDWYEGETDWYEEESDWVEDESDRDEEQTG